MGAGMASVWHPHRQAYVNDSGLEVPPSPCTVICTTPGAWRSGRAVYCRWVADSQNVARGAPSAWTTHDVSNPLPSTSMVAGVPPDSRLFGVSDVITGAPPAGG